MASSTAQNSASIRNIGLILFPAFQALDVFGPLDALNLLSRETQLDLSLISSSLEPISTKPRMKTMNPQNSNFGQSVVPTHTFENAPPLDVLIIPGGVGTRDPDLKSTIDFVRDRFPTLKYVITVCTGAIIAARAGILDGKNATTNKRAWATVTALGPKTSWRAHARWVVDGNIWTAAGISAGIDVTLAWISTVWGKEVAQRLADAMEYERHPDADWDPFSKLYDITDVINGVPQ